MNCITVIVVDDHPVVRMGIEGILLGDKSISLLYVATKGEDAVVQTGLLRPDVLITDLVMPDVSGFDVIRRTRVLSPQTRIIALSSHESPDYVLQALNCGASGFVLKDAEPDEIIAAVHALKCGRRYLSPSLAISMMDVLAKGPEPAQIDPLVALTAREREVFQLTTQGRTNVEIGKTLFISHRTAETHRARAMRKLNLKSPLELALFAVRNSCPDSLPGTAHPQL